jgi:hypothetical protein
MSQSLVLIIPADLRDDANALGVALGMGPDNYSVPLSADGSEPATYYGLHAWASDDFIAMLDSGELPPDVDFPQDEFDAIMAASIQSVQSDPTGHFNDVIAANGLTIVEPPAEDPATP